MSLSFFYIWRETGYFWIEWNNGSRVILLFIIEAVVFSFFFIFPRKLDRVQIRKHPNNWKNERLINLLAWLINNFLPKYDQEIRNFEDQLSIYPFPPPLEKRNIYIYPCSKFNHRGNNIPMDPKTRPKSKPANTCDASKHDQIQSFWHVSSPRQRATRAHQRAPRHAE